MIRLISVKPLPQYQLQVTFNDGVNGIFAVQPERRGGVFLKLLDVAVFKRVTINPDFGCVEWPGGIDLCPDVMHRMITGDKAEPHSTMALREEPKKPR